MHVVRNCPPESNKNFLIASVDMVEMEKIQIAESIGTSYRRLAYDIEYSPELAREDDGRTRKRIRRYEACNRAAYSGKENRIPTAADLVALIQRGSTDPAFDDLFARNEQKEKIWEWTHTDLIRPKYRKMDCTKTKNGRPYWLRIVREGKEEVGELWVPEGKGDIVREWSPFGVPSETSRERSHLGGGEVHFYFDPKQEEIRLVLGWHQRHWHTVKAPCFDLNFCRPDEPTHPLLGYRIVKGYKPSYENIAPISF